MCTLTLNEHDMWCFERRIRKGLWVTFSWLVKLTVTVTVTEHCIRLSIIAKATGPYEFFPDISHGIN